MMMMNESDMQYQPAAYGPPDVKFYVEGVPAPGGSKRGFPVKRAGGRMGVAIVDAGGEKTKRWRACVAAAGIRAMSDIGVPGLEVQRDPYDGPLALYVTFYMPRPAGHFGTGRNSERLREHAPRCCTVKPDATKLLRALEDALTGIVWVDDAQIVVQHVRKVYGHRSGAYVAVWRGKYGGGGDYGQPE